MSAAKSGREALDLEQVRHVAKLAHLVLSQEESEAMRRDLSSILGYVAKLNELDTEFVPATAHAVELTSRTREDCLAAGLPLERALGNAPERIGDGFGVPKIID